jgi:asparagine synthase (glutamine-hydrolysing)
MCGIVGLVSRTPERSHEALGGLVTRMRDALLHRGPDSADTWIDSASGIAGLAQRRLAIIDLSPAGAQPMVSHDGRFVLTFNGEIYNYPELRDALEREAGSVSWRGTSDTEVLLEAMARWGVDAGLRKVAGMFAFGMWDRRDRVLWLGRDRLGEKPLYFGWIGTDFAFASELKAFAQHEQWKPRLDHDALLRFLRFGYVPSPHSIFKDVWKLRAGHFVAITPEARPGTLPVSTAYWNLDEAVARGMERPIDNDDEAEEALRDTLTTAIKGQMISDVPLGAFLSGGVDSSTVVALMQSLSPRPVKTFSIGFHERDFDEAAHAKLVAAHLGTEHHEQYVTGAEALAVVPKLPALYDEPFADSSQIPTYLLSQITRRHVTVSLSGDAGDELFGGYNRYLWGRTLWNAVGWIPAGARKLSARALNSLSPAASKALEHMANVMLPANLRMAAVGDRVQKAASILELPDAHQLHLHLASLWRQPRRALRNPPAGDVSAEIPWSARVEDQVAQMMYSDALSYLTDDILAKVDRAAMGVSLETRVPLLDHRVVELAWSLPMKMRIRNGETKWILRRLLYRHVPRKLIERPKMGFSIPLAEWLRGPLRDWAEELLSPAALGEHRLFDADFLRSMWGQHARSERNHASQLWTVLMFQAWYANQAVKPIVEH